MEWLKSLTSTAVVFGAIFLVAIGITHVLDPFLPEITPASEARLALVGIVLGWFIVRDTISRHAQEITSLRDRIKELEQLAGHQR